MLGMFRRIRELQGALADYTIGTIIVMVHMATAERRQPHALTGRHAGAGLTSARQAAT